MAFGPDDEVLARLGLADAELLAEGFCCRVWASGERVARVPFQGEERTTGAVAAVRLAGVVGPRVYAHDEASGALVMERLRPGRRLSEAALDDDAELALFGRFVRAMRDVPTDGMLPLDAFLDEETHPVRAELLATTRERRFLHGDLHHDNVLADGATWRLIDPKGLVGDPCYEAVAWLRNPIARVASERDLVGLVRRRVAWMERELGLDPRRVLGWALVDREGRDAPGDPWAGLGAAYRAVYDALG